MPILAGLLASFKGNPITFLVKGARAMYWVTAGTISLAWYTGWRNQRTEPGERTPLIPGLTKRKSVHGPDRPDAPPPTRVAGAEPQGSARGNTTGSAGGGGAPGIPLHGAGHPNLVQIGRAAQKMGLHVSEHPAFGGVHPVHHPNSLHYKGRAIDVSGSESQMRAFARAVELEYGNHVAELIHNPGASIKNGKKVPPSFWGADTWANHRNHVHLGI